VSIKTKQQEVIDLAFSNRFLWLMKSSALFAKLVFANVIISLYSNLYAETGKLLMITIGENQTKNLILANQELDTIFNFPSEFTIKDRVQISKERILSLKELSGPDRQITSYEWKTGKVSKLKYPSDTGIKILRGFINYIEELNKTIFQEIHISGEQRLYELAGDKQLFFSHTDKYRKSLLLDDFLPSGAHLYRILQKDKSVQKLENQFVGATDGHSQKLFYCSSLNCIPEEIVSDRAILSARLIHNGSLIAFLTPITSDSDYKSYDLEIYDLKEKKRNKLITVKVSMKGPSGYYNRSNPIFRVLNQSSLFLITEEVSDIEEKIKNWKVVDGVSGKVEDFKVPDGFEWAPMMPVSFHKNTNETDVTTLEPFIVFIKRTFNPKLGLQNQIKVIQFPEGKTVLEKEIIGKTVTNALYVSDSEFISGK